MNMAGDAQRKRRFPALARIGREIASAHEIRHIAMVHRLGRVLIGEASVVVVVTAPHRRPAFAAALEAIDRIKKSAPIWKKEFFEDGAEWVAGENGRAEAGHAGQS